MFTKSIATILVMSWIAVERIRIDGQRLMYKHEVTGPGGKRDERETNFELQP